MKLHFLLFLILSHTFVLFAQTDFDSVLTLEHRQFNKDDDSTTNDHRTTLMYKFTMAKDFESSELKASAITRLGLSDPSNNYLFIEEAFYKKSFESSSVVLGYQIFNWTNLEFLGIVDNINPKNLDSVGAGAERQGVPALSFRKDFEESFIDLIWIIDTQYSILPNKKNRMGVGLELAPSRSLLKDEGDSQDKKEFQYIVRFKKFFEDFEIDMHFARLVDTSDPMAVIEVPGLISPTSADDLDFRAYYLPKNQYAVGTQGSIGAFLLKAEALYIDFADYGKVGFTTSGFRESSQVDHGRLSAGLEYSFELGRQSDMIFLEYTSVFGVTFEEARRLGAFQRDIFFGLRHSLNDFRNNIFSVGFVYDLQDYSEGIVIASHEIKLAQSIKLTTSLMIIETKQLEGNNSQEDFYGLKPLRESDNIQVNLAYYF